MKKVISLLLVVAVTFAFANTNASKTFTGQEMKIHEPTNSILLNKDRDELLNEGFEGTFPPDGWVADGVGTPGDGGSCVWYQGANFHTGAADAYSDWGYGIDTWLKTPSLDFSLGTEQAVTFWWNSSYHWSVDPNDNCDIFVKVSTDGGANWSDVLWTYGEEQYVDVWPWENFTWYESTVDLSAYAGESDVMVGFQIVGDDNSSNEIDDVVITYVPGAGGEVDIFTDDFESGTDKWSFAGGPDWELVETESVSPTHSLTESPAGNYSPDMSYYATMVTPLDLTGVFDAWMTYNIKYEIETGNFDWGYVEVSTDGGANWLNVLQFAATPLTDWENITVPLGGFVGNAAVLIRFSLVTDGGAEFDGMYIDDVVVTTNDEDNTPPLVNYVNPPMFYQASMDAYTFEADLMDISGISEAKVVYQVNGGASEEAMSTGNTGDTYTFEIPAQVAGAEVDFFISSTDNSSNANSGTTDIYHFIQGEYLIYDNAVVDFYTTFATGTGAAVRMTLGDEKQMLWALIRNYADGTNNPEPDNYEFHVWADDFGVPGADLITPFNVLGEATPENSSPVTRVNLSSVSGLENLSGDVFVGFIAVDETFITTSTTSAIPSERSWSFDGSAWTLTTGTDFHFRAVLRNGTGIGEETSSISSFELNQNYPNPFNPTTSISFAIENNAMVQLAVFDAKGALVANLVNGNVNSGAHSVEFNASGLSTGVYYYTLKVNNISTTKKMMLLK